MNDIKRMTRMIGTTLAAAIFLGSCSIGLSPDTAGPEDDLARLDEELNLTANSAVEAAEAQLEASGGIGASTTYNNPGMDPVTVVGEDGPVTLPARSNFPYPGWTTEGTVEHVTPESDWTNSVGSENSLFKVTATATPDESGVYPESEVREVYYVESADDAYDPDTDSIFDPYGFAGSGYRDEYVAEYTDSSTRNHWIIANDDTTYAAFDVDGSLDFDTVQTDGVTTEGAAVYSSSTMYTHELGKTFNYWFWNNNDDVTPYVVGIRYYTEHLEGDEYVGTSLTMEYTYDSGWSSSDETPLLLARTIIREEMRFDHDDTNGDGVFDNGETGVATDHTLRLQTEINNNSGGDGLVYTRQGKSISEWKTNGNAREAQLAGVQRNTLPSGFSNIGEFSTTIDSLTGTTE